MNTDVLVPWIVHLLLIVTRVAALFTFTPLLARPQIPNAAKIGFSLLMGFILINLFPPPAEYPYGNLYALAFAVVCELSVGLVIGFITSLFFNAVYTAAHIIDMQIGFSMAQMYDVTAGTQVAVTSQLLNTALVVSFVFSGGLNRLIELIARSFAVIPVGAGVLRPEIAGLVAEEFTRCFVIALQISMPVLASALLAEVALGVVVRTAPQMNVFVVGIPLKVILGLFILMLSMPVFVTFSETVFAKMFDAIDRVVTGGMVP
ncbi:MAG: flagellar biosynthetic protein FliR [Oscillospiraceae bacterium]|jgi:flagellar biosynthetic protein FliR|nr:flagellar biosynthetic protein FliR [Oscillospiraceae bacterium]